MRRPRMQGMPPIWSASTVIRVSFMVLSETKRLTIPLLHPLQNTHVIRHRRTAHVENAGKAGVLHLDVAGAAHELHRRKRMHRDACRADRVALRLEPARRIDREPAILLGEAVLDSAGAPA